MIYFYDIKIITLGQTLKIQPFSVSTQTVAIENMELMKLNTPVELPMT